MVTIRRAEKADAQRIAEIFVFNYRLNFYPIFKCDEFYFDELTVSGMKEEFKKEISDIFVYDDGTVKGFVEICGREIKRLFVEPVLQGMGIGQKLLAFSVDEKGANTLWALEKNVRAIAFYLKNGFRETNDKKLEEDTDEYLIRLER